MFHRKKDGNILSLFMKFNEVEMNEIWSGLGKIFVLNNDRLYWLNSDIHSGLLLDMMSPDNVEL